MLRSFKYALHPTAAQARALEGWLGLDCELYNAGLEERISAWRTQRKNVSYYDQAAALAEVRFARPEYDAVPIVALRGVLRRLDRAMQAFFRRAKCGQKPGFPRFRSRRRFNSIEINDLTNAAGRIVAGGKRVQIPLLGKVRFKQHRPIQGGATVSKELKERTHSCPSCGYVADRDVNAARNILGRGQRLQRGDLDVAQAPMTCEVSL